MQAITRNQDSTLTVHLLPRTTQSVTGHLSLDWLRSATAIECRVRAPSSRDNLTWAAVESGFPLFSANAGLGGAFEGDTSIFVDSSAVSLQYGDYIAVGRSASESSSEMTIARVVGVTGEGNTVLLGSPLPCDAPGGADVFSLTVRVGVTAAQSLDVGVGTVDVRVTDADGAQWVFSEPFEVVRRVVAWTITPDRLQVLMPSIGHLREADDFTLQETIDATLANEVLPMLRGKGIREHGIRNAAALEAFFIACVQLHLAKNNPAIEIDRLDYWQADAVTKLELALQDRDAWYLDDQTIEAPMPPESESKFLSAIRVTR